MAESTKRCGLLSIWLLVVLLTNWTNGTEYLASRCGETIYFGNSGGTLDSQLGLDYYNNLDCTVTLQTSADRQILLSFTRFRTEGYIWSCSYDYLEVYDGSSTSSQRLAQICGSTVPNDITSSSNSITLRFRTDSSVTDLGFLLAYTSFSTYSFCNFGEFRCNNGQCIDSILQNNGYDNCGDNSDEDYGLCNLSEFTCDNGLCIDYGLWYDGNDDCGDNSDEGGYSSCNFAEFECDNGLCIDYGLKYDGYDDCGDNSDERGYNDDINTATGLLQWGTGVLVAIIIGIIAGAVLLCVCCGCICYHTCINTRPPQHNTIVVANTQQPVAPPPTYMYSQQAPMVMQPYGQPAPYDVNY